MAVIVTTSGDANRHSTNFKMATVLKEWTKGVYSVIRFLRTRKAFRRKRPGLLSKGLGVLLNDNARPHSAATTVNLLNFWGWEILPHPPYSPDLAALDFHLFPKMTYLRGQRFHSNEDVQNDVKKWLCAQDAFYVCEGHDKLIYRYGKCLNRLDDYVEK
jgi:transposase